jgi:hypothetical protein
MFNCILHKHYKFKEKFYCLVFVVNYMSTVLCYMRGNLSSNFGDVLKCILRNLNILLIWMFNYCRYKPITIESTDTTQLSSILLMSNIMNITDTYNAKESLFTPKICV